jgi:hypothetical protein
MVKESLLSGVLMCEANVFVEALPMTSNTPDRILNCMSHEAIGCNVIVEAYSDP